MKFFILFITTLLSLSSFSFEEPYELKGKFMFHGEIRTVEVFSLTKVKANSIKGKKKLKGLIKEGQTCHSKIGFTFYCEKKEELMSAPEVLINEVLEKFENYNIVFKERTSKPSLRFENNKHVHYLVDQNVIINNSIYNKYRYEISAELHRIKSLSKRRGFSFVARSPSQLEFVYDTLVFEEGDNKFRYVFFIGLDKD